eukprot:gene36389-49012_t
MTANLDIAEAEGRLREARAQRGGGEKAGSLAHPFISIALAYSALRSSPKRFATSPAALDAGSRVSASARAASASAELGASGSPARGERRQRARHGFLEALADLARHRRLAFAMSLLTCVPSFAQSPTVDLRILAINDFHGNLRPPPGGIAIDDPADKTKKIMVPAGGAEHMATLVKQLRTNKANSIFVAAGDLIGASPFLSAMFHDEPTIESLSMMGLDVASVGNHEFDEGLKELQRMQNGGCHPTDGCQGPHPFAGATFNYLAASTIATATGQPVFPPYAINTFDGVPVAFIGLTLKGTANIVSPAGIAGLEFRDESDTVNALVPELKAKGVEAIVVLIHEGGSPTGNYNGLDALGFQL